MSDMQNPPEGSSGEGTVDDGIVHVAGEAALEAPPEPPPQGPIVWAQENLISGATRSQRILNGFLTLAFTLIALNAVQFITGYFFDEERRWGAVTYNMKLMMVQAFPQDDLERIWISVGIFMVLVAWSLVAWKSGGMISIHALASNVRSAGVFLVLVTILHAGSGADSIAIPFLPDLDLPGTWSGARWTIFLFALGMAPIGYLVLNRYGDRAKEMLVPFLSVFPVFMVLIIAVLSVLELPLPVDRFTEAPAPIAGSTISAWSILFAVTVGGYFVGKMLDKSLGDRFRRIVVILWIISYPIIVMIIQRNPILIWDEIFSLAYDAPLGALLIGAIVGSALVWWLAAPDTGEEVRIAGFVLVLVAAGLFIIPMAFLWRAIMIAFSMMAVAAPSFGGTKTGQRRMVRIWLIVVFVIVLVFVLGEADTSLQFQGTTFLGGFNLTILLAITGLVLSFPLGLVLGLARRSTMPIFRLLATTYH